MTYDRYLSRGAALLRESAIRKMGSIAARVPDLISLAPGYPDPATFPWDAFREIASELLTGQDVNALQYGATRGYRPLLEEIDGVLASRGIRSTLDERLITTGSQQGLDLIARVLLDPNDVVLVELPTYTGAITAFQHAQAELVGIRQEADGVELASLDETFTRLAAAGRRVKFLYVVPNFQNPTGLLIGLDKRLRLLEWAERRDVLLVEDDPYGDLYFPDAAAPRETRPIKADDHTGRVVYLSSFSKTLAPGFRVAWVVAPEPLITKIDIAKQAADICAGALDQRVVHQAIRRGVLAAQGDRLRAHYMYKRTVMQQALAASIGSAITCQAPRGGFFLWATLRGALDAEQLLAHAIEAKVSFVVGSAFFVDGTGGSTLRLSFSQPSADRLVEGVSRLAAALERTGTGAVQRSAGPAPTAASGISSPKG
jgi:2-aminoadipate transaminase